MRLIWLDIWMTSPLIRHSFLLSSRTVFMFSIQTASIGPSKMTHFLSRDVDDANSRNVFATMPSDHWKKTDTICKKSKLAVCYDVIATSFPRIVTSFSSKNNVFFYYSIRPLKAKGSDCRIRPALFMWDIHNKGQFKHYVTLFSGNLTPLVMLITLNCTSS